MERNCLKGGLRKPCAEAMKEKQPSVSEAIDEPCQLKLEMKDCPQVTNNSCECFFGRLTEDETPNYRMMCKSGVHLCLLKRKENSYWNKIGLAYKWAWRRISIIQTDCKKNYIKNWIKFEMEKEKDSES